MNLPSKVELRADMIPVFDQGELGCSVACAAMAVTVEGKMRGFMQYNEKAAGYLKSLYESVGATTPEQQFNTLFLKLGYGADDTVITYSKELTWEQKRATLEYELLDREKLIELHYM